MSSEKPIIGLLVFLAIVGGRIALRSGFRNAGSEQVEYVGYVVEDLEALIFTSSEVNDLLANIQDSDTALQATADLPDLLEVLTEEMEIFIEDALYYEEIAGEEFRVSLSNKREFEALDERAMQLGFQLSQKIETFSFHVERISELEGLPAEFWDVFSVEMLRTSLLFVEMSKLDDGGPPLDSLEVEQISTMVALLDEHGPRRVVLLELINASQETVDETARKCEEIAGNGAKVSNWYDPDLQEGTIVVAPTDKFAEFSAAFPPGSLTLQDEARRSFAAEIGISSAFPTETAQREVEPVPEATVVEPAEVQTSAPEDPPRVVEVEAEVTGIEEVEEAEEPSVNAEPPEPKPLAEVLVVEQELVEEEVVEAEDEGGFPLLADPKYHEKLAQLMVDGDDSRMQRDAIEALLLVDPRDIQDKAVRKQIARNFHQLVFDEASRTDRQKAIEGLIHYGRKYSVPFLLELLEDRNLRNSEVVFDGLAKFPTEASAAAVTALVEDNRSREQAIECLRKMGRAAEPALIELVPSEDRDVMFLAMDLLGELGTEKSYSSLRRVVSEYKKELEVKQRAKAAIKSIRDRTSAAKKAA